MSEEYFKVDATLSQDDRIQITVDAAGMAHTSAIYGESFSYSVVQEAIKQQLGISNGNVPVDGAEIGAFVDRHDVNYDSEENVTRYTYEGRVWSMSSLWESLVATGTWTSDVPHRLPAPVGKLTVHSPRPEIDFDVLESGALRITMNVVAREELKTTYQECGYQEALSTLIEVARSGYNYEFVMPEQINALTDAPIFAEDMTIEDNGACTFHGKVWWLANYALVNEIEELVEKGEVEFQLGMDFGNEPHTVPAYGTKEWEKVNREAYENCVPWISQGSDAAPSP